MKNYLTTIAIVLLACGCGKDEQKGSKNQGAAATASEPVATPPEPKQPAAPARDPELAKLLKAGEECTWDNYGMTRCEAAEKVKKLAFNKQSNDELAKSCAGALKDAEASSRGLAAICLKNFNEVTQTPHLGALLDAYEAEKDANVKIVLACAASYSNASKAGVEDRVIGLVRGLMDQPDSDRLSGCLFGSTFQSYLMGKPEPPSKAVGDLALKLLAKDGFVRDRALEVVVRLNDRAPEVCAELNKRVSAEDWARSVDAMARMGDACTDSLDTVIGVMAKAMIDGKYNTNEYSATRQVLKRMTLSKAQLGKLKKGSKKQVKKAKGVWEKSAKEIATLIAEYKPPTVKDGAAAK